MRFAPISLFRISGGSMEPNFSNGDLVLVFNWAYLLKQIKKGDVVIFLKNGKKMIKRISNIKTGEVFLEGDNKAASTDSRKFGWVKRSDIIGKVIFKGF